MALRFSGRLRVMAGDVRGRVFDEDEVVVGHFFVLPFVSWASDTRPHPFSDPFCWCSIGVYTYRTPQKRRGEQMGATQDRLDVIELIHRYAAMIDFKNYDEVDRVFTKDAVANYESMRAYVGDDFEPKGAKAIGEWLRKYTGTRVSMHYMHNHVVELDGKRATMRNYMHNTNSSIGGVYTPRKRTKAGWRLHVCASTTLHRRGPRSKPHCPVEKPLARPPARLRCRALRSEFTTTACLMASDLLVAVGHPRVGITQLRRERLRAHKRPNV